MKDKNEEVTVLVTQTIDSIKFHHTSPNYEYTVRENWNWRRSIDESELGGTEFLLGKSLAKPSIPYDFYGGSNGDCVTASARECGESRIGI